MRELKFLHLISRHASIIAVCFLLTLILFAISRALSGIDMIDYMGYQANASAILEYHTNPVKAVEWGMFSDTAPVSQFSYPNELFSFGIYGIRKAVLAISGHDFLAGGFCLNFLALFIGIISLYKIGEYYFHCRWKAFLLPLFVIASSPIILLTVGRSITDGCLWGCLCASLAVILYSTKPFHLWIAGGILAIGVMCRLQGLCMLPFLPLLWVEPFSWKNYLKRIVPLLVPSVIGLLFMSLFLKIYVSPFPGLSTPGTSLFYWPSILNMLSSISVDYLPNFLKNISYLLRNGLSLFFLFGIFFIFRFWKKKNESVFSRREKHFFLVSFFFLLMPTLLYSTDVWPVCDPRYWIYGFMVMGIIGFQIFTKIFESMKNKPGVHILKAAVLICYAFLALITTFGGVSRYGIWLDDNKVNGLKNLLNPSFMYDRTFAAYAPIEDAQEIIRENFSDSGWHLTNHITLAQVHLFPVKIVLIPSNQYRVIDADAFLNGKQNHLFSGILLYMDLNEKNLFFKDKAFVREIKDHQGVIFDLIWNSQTLYTEHPVVIGYYKRRA